MNTDVSSILGTGSLMVAAAVLALALIVRGDLVPVGMREGGGRWFLGGALGVGVVAFTIKLAVIALVSTFPAQTIGAREPASRRPSVQAVAPTPVPLPAARAFRPHAWQALPEQAPAPPDNPTTADKAALGERLFHDPALSADHTVSCATCHAVRTGAGDDGTRTAVGITRTPGARNTPTVFNAAFQARLFWDGRASSLEQQARGPLVNPDEMGMPSLEAVEQRVRADATYRAAFDRAFGPGTAITIDRITQAIASYERTLVTADTPYDRFVRGDPAALSAAQQRGMWQFQAVGCATCHSGPNFSGASVLGQRAPFMPLMVERSDLAVQRGLGNDKGLAGADAAAGIWRVPSLRNVALTGPYFHNGSVGDLDEAVRIMAATQLNARVGDDPSAPSVKLWWSPETQSFMHFERRRVTERDVADIVAFLKALSSDSLVGRLPK